MSWNIECMNDSNDGSTYYELSEPFMQRVVDVLEHINTDGAMLTDELKEEVHKILKMISKGCG